MAKYNELVKNKSRVRVKQGVTYEGKEGVVTDFSTSQAAFKTADDKSYVVELESLIVISEIVIYESGLLDDSSISFSAKRRKQLNAGKVFHFVKGKSEFNQTDGWRPREISDFDPVAPTMVLHDILEHEPGSPATPEEEYKALGTTHYMRFEGGYFGTTRPSDALTGAFGMLFFHTIKAGRATTPADRTDDNAFLPLERIETEWEMARAVSQAMEFLPGKFNETQMRYIRQSMVHALPWMRVGYRRAAKRFAGLSQSRLSKMYTLAQEEIAFHLKRATDTDVLQIVCNPHQYQAAVSMLRPISA